MAEDRELTASRWLGATWAYTLLRIALFLAIWGILVLCGVGGYLGAFIAAVLSIPLSFVLLARPRATLARAMELRIEQRKVDRADLNDRLEGLDDE